MKKLVALSFVALSIIITPQFVHADDSPTCIRKITGSRSKNIYVLKTTFKKRRVVSHSNGKRRSFPAKIVGTKIRYKARGDRKWYTLTEDGKIFRSGVTNAVGTHNCNITNVIAYMKNL